MRIVLIYCVSRLALLVKVFVNHSHAAAAAAAAAAAQHRAQRRKMTPGPTTCIILAWRRIDDDDDDSGHTLRRGGRGSANASIKIGTDKGLHMLQLRRRVAADPQQLDAVLLAIDGRGAYDARIGLQ